MSPGRAVSLLVMASVLVVLPGPAAAQEPTLGEVEELIRAGRADDARSTLTRWATAVEGNLSRAELQRSIWLRAILTVDPSEAALDLERLVVEFPGGPWTDEALRRLAQLAAARGDTVGAAEYYRTLVRDHPGSPERLEARRWLDENAEAVAVARVRAREASADAARMEPAAGEETDESAPEAEVDSLARSAPADSIGEVDAAPEEPPESEEPTAPEELFDFAVQVGAFESPVRARNLFQTVIDTGFEARLVSIPGSDLVRVRVGNFLDPEAATRVYDRLVAAGFDALVVAGAASEVPVG